MRALIRGNEVICEPFSEWMKANLRWLTGTERSADGRILPGDGWTLVENYIEVADGAIYDVAVYPEPEDPAPEVQDYVVIDGVRYIRQ